MPRFHDLTVTDIQNTTRDAVVLTLKAPADFDFIQGQYLTLRSDFDGEELRRCYSICSGLDDGKLQIGIKRVDGGAFSNWAHSTLKIGDKIQSLPPMGRFHAALHTTPRSYLMVAVGSGITPIMSTIKTLLSREPDSQVTLIFGNRNIHSIMFKSELEDLKNQYLSRLNLIHILKNDAQDIDLFQGRIDAPKCEALFETCVDVSRIDQAFICGPQDMMKTVSTALQSNGLPADHIKYELFTSDQQGRAKQRVASIADHLAQGANATIMLDGATRSFVIGQNQSLLEAGLANAIDMPFACKAGVCSTCRCKVLEGEVEMIANHALEDYEVEKGYVLSCQSYPISENLVVDYDQ